MRVTIRPQAYAWDMARLGLFPLPLVLVPTERVPLHIFEPRYRELIGECIDLEQEFGLTLIDDPPGVVPLTLGEDGFGAVTPVLT